MYVCVYIWMCVYIYVYIYMFVVCMYVCNCTYVMCVWFVCCITCSAVSISTLRQVAVDKMEQVPTLGQVMPYLDVTSKQDYVVQRLRGQYQYMCVRVTTDNGIILLVLCSCSFHDCSLNCECFLTNYWQPLYNLNLLSISLHLSGRNTFPAILKSLANGVCCHENFPANNHFPLFPL